MPEYFTASKYKSFQRSLNLWGFETVSKGPNKGVCSHPFFIRGDPSKTNLMKRVKVKSTALDATKKSPTKGPQSTTAEEQASLSLLSLNATAASNAVTAAGRANSIIPSPAVWGRSHLSLIHQIAGVTPSASSILQARDAYLEQALALELLAQRERSLIDAISVIKSARQLLEPSELGAAFSTGIWSVRWVLSVFSLKQKDELHAQIL